jgi:hypothetical protein
VLGVQLSAREPQMQVPGALCGMVAAQVPSLASVKQVQLSAEPPRIERHIASPTLSREPGAGVYFDESSQQPPVGSCPM